MTSQNENLNTAIEAAREEGRQGKTLLFRGRDFLRAYGVRPTDRTWRAVMRANAEGQAA